MAFEDYTIKLGLAQYAREDTKRPSLVEPLVPLGESWFAKYIVAMKRGDYRIGK